MKSVVILSLAVLALSFDIDGHSNPLNRMTFPQQLDSNTLYKRGTCGGTLQKRGQCLAKPDSRDRRVSPLSGSGSPGTPRGEAHRSPVNILETPTTPTTPRRGGTDMSRGPSHQRFFRISPSPGVQRSSRSEIHATALLSTMASERGPRPPSVRVKMRGPGLMEVDNMSGIPRSTFLEPGERGVDSLQDPAGASSIAFTAQGGRSRSKGKGGMVTAKVHKHGIGEATVQVKEPGRTSYATVDSRTYGTTTFSASSHDPANPASIRVGASGSIYTSMLAQDRDTNYRSSP